jgi:hypothetical protein
MGLLKLLSLWLTKGKSAEILDGYWQVKDVEVNVGNKAQACWGLPRGPAFRSLISLAESHHEGENDV